jgi:hypothetical protein
VTAAAIGLILFFVGAIITHLRARDYSFGLAVAFLLLAVAAFGVATGLMVSSKALGRKEFWLWPSGLPAAVNQARCPVAPQARCLCHGT